MNLQEIFDKVVDHLKTQNKQAVDDEGDCLYRTQEGLKCAIGCLIPDEWYTPNMEIGGPITTNTLVKQVLSGFAGIDIFSEGVMNLLKSLQHVHDRNFMEGFTKEFSEVLVKVAKKYNLACDSIGD